MDFILIALILLLFGVVLAEHRKVSKKLERHGEYISDLDDKVRDHDFSLRYSNPQVSRLDERNTTNLRKLEHKLMRIVQDKEELEKVQKVFEEEKRHEETIKFIKGESE